MEVLDGELLILKRVLRDHLHVLGKHLSHLLRDHATHAHIFVQVAHLAPLIRVLVAADLEFENLLEKSLLVHVLDLFLDSFVG